MVTASRPLRADAARNREKLLAAATELFAERGLDVPMEHIARKAEQRFEEQRQAQRDDFQRWLQEHGLVKIRTKPAEETARAVLGQGHPCLLGQGNR